MVTLIGEGITVDELAHHFGTIGYEVLTSLGKRYARIYKGGEAKSEKDERGQPRRARCCDAAGLTFLKIATFNINNVNRRLPNLLRWLRAAKPDVVCLQELKSTDADFPTDAIAKAGYGAVWRGQKTWNGVAILARKTEPVLISDRAARRPEDTQARYIEAAVGGIIVTSIYLPNGNPQPGPKFDYKLDWFKRLHRHATTFLKQDIPVVLAGDFNVAPTDARHLSDALVGQGCADPAEKPRRLQSAGGARLDRRDPHAASGKTDVHLLGLQAQPLAARRRPAAGSSPAQPASGAAPDQGRRRPRFAAKKAPATRAGVGRPAISTLRFGSVSS